VFLKPGDEVAISVTGLGTLSNKVSSSSSTNPTIERVQKHTSIPWTNTAKFVNGTGLCAIDSKKLYHRHLGSASPSAPQIVFIHGLGGTHSYFTPLISTLDLISTHSLHLYDLEGHGLSPTSPLSKITIPSLASDLKGIFATAGISSGATVIAHSMGCLVALSFAISNPGLVAKLVLMNPPPNPLPEADGKGFHEHAQLARTQGMAAVVDAFVTGGLSEATKKSNPLAEAAVRLSLLGQYPEGFAKVYTALAGATEVLDCGVVDAETLVITGEEDGVATLKVCEELAGRLKECRKPPVVLGGVGHWLVFEDCGGVTDAIKDFL